MRRCACWSACGDDGGFLMRRLGLRCACGTCMLLLAIGVCDSRTLMPGLVPQHACTHLPILVRSSQPGSDPFTEQRKAKKERVAKQEKARLANLQHAVEVGGKRALPPTLRLAASLPEHGRGKPIRSRDFKNEVLGRKESAVIHVDLDMRPRFCGSVRWLEDSPRLSLCTFHSFIHFPPHCAAERDDKAGVHLHRLAGAVRPRGARREDGRSQASGEEEGPAATGFQGAGRVWISISCPISHRMALTNLH